MIDGAITGKSLSFSGYISDRLFVVFVRAEPHKGYVTEIVQSSAVWSQGLAPEAWKDFMSDQLHQKGFTSSTNLSKRKCLTHN